MGWAGLWKEGRWLPKAAGKSAVARVSAVDGDPQLEVEHFIAYLGLEMWHGDGCTWGRVAVRPEMWASGSRRPRLGLLFTLADVVGGSPPTGTLTPTIDLRLQLLRPAPSEGEILIEARPLKIGRRLWTGEVLFRTPGSSDLFARGEFCFMNQRIADRLGREPFHGRARSEDAPFPAESFDDLLQMRFLDGGAVEMDPHEAVRNGVVGTIQGGAQATMCEVAAERALAERGEYVVVRPAPALPERAPGWAGPGVPGSAGGRRAPTRGAGRHHRLRRRSTAADVRRGGLSPRPFPFTLRARAALVWLGPAWAPGRLPRWGRVDGWAGLTVGPG